MLTSGSRNCSSVDVRFRSVDARFGASSEGNSSNWGCVRKTVAGTDWTLLNVLGAPVSDVDLLKGRETCFEGGSVSGGSVGEGVERDEGRWSFSGDGSPGL